MNTNSPSFRALVLAAALLGAFATAGFAGPGPQYWVKPAKPSAPDAKTATATPAAATCSACKTTNTVVVHDRGPAGQGVPGTAIAASKHECARCAGTIVAANNAVKDTMKRDAASCAVIACCK